MIKDVLFIKFQCIHTVIALAKAKPGRSPKFTMGKLFFNDSYVYIFVFFLEIFLHVRVHFVCKISEKVKIDHFSLAPATKEVFGRFCILNFYANRSQK